MKYEIESTNQYDKWFTKQKDIARALGCKLAVV